MNKPKYRKVYGGDGAKITPRIQNFNRRSVKQEIPVEQQLSAEELGRLHANIHYTHAVLAAEAKAKMDE